MADQPSIDWMDLVKTFSGPIGLACGVLWREIVAYFKDTKNKDREAQVKDRDALIQEIKSTADKALSAVEACESKHDDLQQKHTDILVELAKTQTQLDILQKNQSAMISGKPNV